MTTLKKHSFLREQASTSGTADFTLPGAGLPGFLAFSDRITPGANAIVSYTAHDKANKLFERGIGLLSASTTLQRLTVIENSAGTTAKINFTAAPVVYCDSVESGSAFGKNKYDATAQPTGTNNYAEGYSEGSLWMCSVPSGGLHVYACMSPGNPAAPDAFWMKISGIIDMFDSPYTAASKASVALGIQDDYTASPTDVTGVVGVGMGGEAQNHVSLLQGHGYEAGNYGSHQTERFGMTGFTSDDTPTPLTNESTTGAVNRAYIPIPENSAQVIEGWIVAYISGSSNSKFWYFELGVQRDTGTDPVLKAAATVTAKFGTTGTAPAITVDTAVDGIEIEVTGVAATDIAWTMSCKAVTAGMRA